MKVDFWLLSRDPAERVVAMIAERVLGDGGRVLVVSEDAAQRDALDAALWEGKPEAFLAHGTAGGEHDARQPILISSCSSSEILFSAHHPALFLIHTGTTCVSDDPNVSVEGITIIPSLIRY